MSGSVRLPAVAGTFYPADPRQLHAMVSALLAGAERPALEERPKALIVPHAGYVYSGPVAATAYAAVAPWANEIRRVVLLGPSHRVPLRGIAAPTVEAFLTPLGAIPLDRVAIAEVAKLPQVGYWDEAHRHEHSLEVQLPFLQEVLPRFALVPLVVGETPPAQVAEALELLWGGDETLIVVSTDLSHYHGYREARLLDERTCRAIEALDYAAIDAEDACGCYPLKGLLYLARAQGLRPITLDLRNSGDTAGPRDRVVGYGAWAVAEGLPGVV
ncbi:MAG: MEMO1 family protein [Porticoccaceae bacterium]|nr:MAG: MEMO1 family protein [Porticoccaceae bacterium]